MKTAWVILIISAITDGLIAAGTGLTAVLVETKAMPNDVTWLVTAVGFLLAGARTVQQAMKAAQAPESVENLSRHPKK